MRKFSFTLFLILAYQFSSAQGHWETDFWKKPLKQNADLNGIYTEHYKSGELRLKGNYKNGMPDSTWVYYNKAGLKVVASNYNGIYMKWQFDGSLATLGYYKDGVRVGLWEDGWSSLDSVVQIVQEEYDFDTEILKTYLPQGTLKMEQKMSAKNYNRRANNQGGGFIDVQFGVQHIDTEKLNEYLVAEGRNPISPFSNVYAIAIGGNMYNNLTFFLSYNRLMQNQVVAWDSLSENIYGGHLKYEMGYDAIKTNLFDIGPSMGVGFGRVRFNYEEKISNWTLHLDFNIAGRINVPLSKPIGVAIGSGLSLGFRTGYKVDFAATSWSEPFDGNILKETGTKLSGYYVMSTLSLFLF